MQVGAQRHLESHKFCIPDLESGFVLGRCNWCSGMVLHCFPPEGEALWLRRWRLPLNTCTALTLTLHHASKCCQESMGMAPCRPLHNTCVTTRKHLSPDSYADSFSSTILVVSKIATAFWEPHPCEVGKVTLIKQETGSFQEILLE